MTNLYKKEFKEITTEQGLRNGKNELSTLNNTTEILVVGSLIPEGLFYYFTGKNKFLYECIDEARGTNFCELVLNPDNLDKIQNLLTENKIAFIDTCKCALIKEHSNRDEDIEAFVFEDSILKYYNSNKGLRIYCISRDVEKILKLKGIKCEYHHFFRGGKGITKESRKSEWKNIFKK